MTPLAKRISDFTQAYREVVILLVLAVVCAAFYFIQPGEVNRFLTIDNWRVIAVNISTDALMVVGMTLIIIAGGFDLSVGSTVALGGIIACKLMVGGTPIPVAITAGLLGGAAVGAVNGFIITKVGVNPLIATLGTMIIVRGLCLVAVQASPVTGLPPAFAKLGDALHLGEGFALPYSVLLMIIIVLVGDLLLRHSRFLRQVYYVGGNEEAARFSGIQVDRVRMFTYMLTGALAALAGIVNASRLISASANAGERAELRVISAVVIGGASLAGGTGTVLGAFLGLLLVGVIENGMEILGVNIYMKNVVLGTILILAVTFDRIDKNMWKRLRRWFRT
ncbi:MAG: ABC transporter permease [Verrucomicrobiia bacterium]